MMISGKMGVATRRQLPFVLVILAVIYICSVACEPATGNGGGFKESVNGDEQPQIQMLGLNRADVGLASPLRANSRLLAVPLSLARYMFPHSRPGDHQAQATLMGAFGGPNGASNNKRSSSQLDALTGVTGLGKRSVPVEYINLEPVFRGQTFMRGPARAHDMRWAPMDSVEAPIMTADY